MIKKAAPNCKFLLERYVAGDVTAEERERIEITAALNANVAESIADLQRSNAEILARYPASRLVPEITARYKRGQTRQKQTPFQLPPVRMSHKRVLFASGIAAGLAAAVLLAVLPVLHSGETASYSATQAAAQGSDRVKGAQTAASTELRVYLKTAAAPAADPLPDKTVVQAGNTVQLAYMVGAPEKYGVIFSVDGRGVVTMHYPATVSQSTKLIAGKQTPLDEAYTLDDAPDYEAFFFVVDDAPLDAKAVLNKAEELAGNPRTAPEELGAAFGEYEIKSITLVKLEKNGR
jgi:hypothetical protein